MITQPLKFRFFLLCLLVCLSNRSLIAQDANFSNSLPTFSNASVNWVDSVYKSLSLDEKIGQLFMVAAYSGTEKYNEGQIQQLIKNFKIGGLIFMQGTATKQAELTNKFQQLSKVPLLIGMDAEWGLGMRLQGIQDLPKQMFLGATRDDKLMYNYGQFVAAQCRRLGVHINFAPVVDVNNNPNNPVINFRSFGEDKTLVSQMGIAYMKGLQKNGVIACAKHFPGHGDTDVDSHLDLPTITKSKTSLEQIEFYPFKELIRAGVQSFMIAHLNIPSLESKKNLPTTLSKNVVTNLLKNEMRFKGLVFTDALNMQGVTKYYKPGEVDYLAFEAGNDVLLFSENVSLGIQKIKESIDNGDIKMERLEESVRKILTAKYEAGLNKVEKINSENIDDDINELTSVFRNHVAEKGICLLSDPNKVIEKNKKNSTAKIAYVFIGTSSNTAFTNALKKNNINNIFYANTSVKQERTKLKQSLSNYDAVLVGIHNLARYPKGNYGLDEGEIDLINELSKNKNSLNVLFGNPYALTALDKTSGYLICFEENEETFTTALKILLGKMNPQGKLPVSVTATFPYQSGITSSLSPSGERVIEINKNDEWAKRFREKNETEKTNSSELTCCVKPESIGADKTYLANLDNLISNAIRDRVFPGCRILAAKDGKVFYDRSFGYLNYEKRTPVTENTLYDVASLTKIAATTLAVMKLYEEGKIHLDATLGKYLPMTRGTNKQNLTIKNILTHQAGLSAWIPFYKETLDEYGYPQKSIYQERRGGLFTLEVCNGLYMNKTWTDTMWKRILDSPLDNLGRYKYSDLDFIFLQKIVETLSGKSLDSYVSENFYKPLGLNNILFNPKQNNKQNTIAPTEDDVSFRHKIIQGYVHDMGAAMFGGVGGHAGLFSTAGDLGVLTQMLLNYGEYNGKRYLKESTVKLFTAKNSFISRRGLGFDKPEPNKGKAQPTALNCSLQTFGHTGFTGTCVWADPVHNIQFIFLSNRTFPSTENKKINSQEIREKAQGYIYKSLGINSR